MERLVETVGAILVGYLGLGVLAAVGLHARGLRTLDPATVGAGIRFRLLITPGLIALWPILVRRWLRGGDSPPPPDPGRPVSPRGLRSAQRIVVRLVAVIVAVGATAAIAQRPGDPERVRAPETGALEVVAALDPAPLSDVALTLGAPFPSLPIEAEVRADGAGARQLALTVARDLTIPTLTLYWLPGAAVDPNLEGPGEQGVFLGPVWGPGTRRLSLPASVTGTGTLLLYSVARSEVVARATVDLGG